MINRENWKDVQEYLNHVRRIGRDLDTVKKIQTCLNHLLEWADETPFHQVKNFEPAFPTYLLTSRRDGKDKILSAASLKKICEYTRLFFVYIRDVHSTRYKNITLSWIETIRPSISRGMHSEYHEHEFYTLDMMQKIAAWQPKTSKQARDRAAACFLYLSAMRAQAFVSMPVRCVDLVKHTISQIPELGVRTKNRKAAKTQLLRIPELQAVINEWDARVRNESGDALWYAVLSRDGDFVHRETLNWHSRRLILERGIRDLCEAAGIKYLSPHCFRHGHIYYMMMRVQDMKQLKALSQNVMHSSVAITDGIYGKLVTDDIKTIYEQFGEDDSGS